MRQEQSFQVEIPDQQAIQPGSVAEAPTAPPESQAGLKIFYSWMRDLFFCIAFCFFFIFFIYQPVKVEGGSMGLVWKTRNGSSSTVSCIAGKASTAVTSSCSGIHATRGKAS